MALISIGDMAQSFLLRRHTVALKTQLNIATTESATGQAADLTRQLRGDHSALGGIDASLSRLAAYRVAGAEAGLLAGTMQAALGTMDAMAADLAPQLMALAQPTSAASVSALAADGRQRLASTVALLNTRVADRAVFAGQKTDGAALSDADTILSALEAAISTAGAVTVSDIETAVSDWFDDPAGYQTLAYQGGDPLAPVAVSDTDRAALDFTAIDPAIRDTMKGLAMVALLDRGLLAGQPVAEADLAKVAGNRLSQTQTARTELQARLGVVEQLISTTGARNSAEGSALGIARNAIVAVDPYEAATRLQETQTQLETLYALTARLQRLNLADFLK